MKEYCTALALMHDLLEDTKYDVRDLHYHGVSQRFINCLIILTQKDGEDYVDYLANIKKHYHDYPEAYYVKMADMKDHLLQKKHLNRSIEGKVS